MAKKFEIIIGSPIDYVELVAYIVINGKHIALLNQDDGKDKMKIEFFSGTELGKIDIDVIIEALQEAKNELLK